MFSIACNNRATKPRQLFLALTVFAISFPTSAQPGECDLSEAELNAAAAADRRYAEAWLSNDPDRVMATLGPAPVIVPSGMDPIAGPGPIRNFWFPEDSPPTVVHAFELAQQEVAGSCDLAYVRGSFSLSFDFGDQSYDSEGTYLTILRRHTDGEWRITRRTWNDHQRSVAD